MRFIYHNTSEVCIVTLNHLSLAQGYFFDYSRYGWVFPPPPENLETRMHSSRMHTVHSSSRLLGGVCSQGDVCSQGGLLPGGGILACTEADKPLWTDRCKNITFATSLWTVKSQWQIRSKGVIRDAGPLGVKILIIMQFSAKKIG